MNLDKVKILIYKVNNEYYTSLFQNTNTKRDSIRIEIKVLFNDKEDEIYINNLFYKSKLKYLSIDIKGVFSFETINNQFNNLVLYAKLIKR